MKRTCILSFVFVFAMILTSDPAGAVPCTWEGVERIVAVGDVHGDYDQFTKVLKAAGLIDDNSDWTGGKTHLVQIGDVLDRGPDSKKVMDLLMKLESQSRMSGGVVHALIGNHEAMIMAGDLRYAHPDEIESHGGQEGFTQNFRTDGKYGSWIAGHNAVIRINNTLFVHGGLSVKYAGMDIGKINELIRSELGVQDQSKTAVTYDDEGPLWFRGYALEDENAIKGPLQEVFGKMSVYQMVVGHTVAKGGITSRFEGRLIMIDVGLSNCYGGPAECLLIENGHCYIVGPGQKTEIPVTSDETEPVPEKVLQTL